MSSKKLKQNSRLAFVTKKYTKQDLTRSIDNANDSTIAEKFTHLRKLVLEEGYLLEYEFSVEDICFKFCAHRYNHDTNEHEKILYVIPAADLRKYFRYPIDRADIFIELEKKKAQASFDICSFFYEIITDQPFYDD